APGLSGKGKEAEKIEISDDLRQTDAFMMVVNAFSSDANPRADIQALSDEMILLDYVLAEQNAQRRARKMKLTGDKSEKERVDLLQRCMEVLEQERPLIECEFNATEEKLLRGYQFLTLKPQLIVINIGEDDLAGSAEIEQEYSNLIRPGHREVAVMCGKIQMDLVGLDDDERREFMDDLGITTSATDKVIQKSYQLLGLISFLTTGEPEVRAWTISKGFTAQKAAGVIHSDIERGFIRAEVVAYDDYIRLKTPAAIKAAGKGRLEGKEYVVMDGDVILFRFNV
ncbi:MAG: DUF933 domain-containing protein, partial [candidate division Zixibacteria bacterium]|nr:DUF933 domain-containing protein [candidate division Zixibacteria bacterium]